MKIKKIKKTAQTENKTKEYTVRNMLKDLSKWKKFLLEVNSENI